MYEKTTLDNGLRILTCTMPHTRSVTVAFFIGAGSRYEDDAHGGVSHFVEHMLFKGTARRPEAKDVSSTIESVGGLLNASTDREMTVCWAKVARPHFALAFDLLTDIICHSKVRHEEVKRERSVVLEELNMTNDHPDMRVSTLIDEVMWPNQPMGRDVGGSRESVQSITRKMMVDYMSHQYVPANMVLSVAGNITHTEVVDAVRKAQASWTEGVPLAWYPALDGQTTPQVHVEHRRTDQAHLCVAIKGLPAQHRDRYALDLLSAILGEGMSSRLFVELRERRGLAYDVHSFASHFRDCGAVTIYGGVDVKRVDAAITAIMGELHSLRDGVPEEELGRTKELLKGRLLLRMEDTRAVVGWMGAQEILRGNVLTPDDVVEHIQAVTSDDVRRVARDLLVLEKMSMALVGPYRSLHRFQGLFKL